MSFTCAAAESGVNGQSTNGSSAVVSKVQCNECRGWFRTPAVLHMHKVLCHKTEKVSSQAVDGIANSAAPAGASSTAGPNDLVACKTVHAGECFFRYRLCISLWAE